MTDPTSSTTIGEIPHSRWNPLLREWILVSPHRTQRPWQGQVAATAPPSTITYDRSCYLCPGNDRAGGAKNPKYTSTFVFKNDYAALLPDTPEAAFDREGLLVAKSECGVCRVVCLSPRHDLTVARMTLQEVRTVIDVWSDQFRQLEA